MIVSGPVLPIPRPNIDTDQIIPARFLTTTTKDGLGKQLFADWRYRADGSPNPEFVLNRPEAVSYTHLSARSASANVAAGRASPVASMAAPPSSADSN